MLLRLLFLPNAIIVLTVAFTKILFVILDDFVSSYSFTFLYCKPPMGVCLLWVSNMMPECQICLAYWVPHKLKQIFVLLQGWSVGTGKKFSGLMNGCSNFHFILFLCNWFIKGIIYVTACGILLYRNLFSLKNFKLFSPLLLAAPPSFSCKYRLFLTIVIQRRKFNAQSYSYYLYLSRKHLKYQTLEVYTCAVLYSNIHLACYTSIWNPCTTSLTLTCPLVKDIKVLVNHVESVT